MTNVVQHLSLLYITLANPTLQRSRQQTCSMSTVLEACQLGLQLLSVFKKEVISTSVVQSCKKTFSVLLSLLLHSQVSPNSRQRAQISPLLTQSSEQSYRTWFSLLSYKISPVLLSLENLSILKLQWFICYLKRVLLVGKLYIRKISKAPWNRIHQWMVKPSNSNPLHYHF